MEVKYKILHKLISSHSTRSFWGLKFQFLRARAHLELTHEKNDIIREKFQIVIDPIPASGTFYLIPYTCYLILESWHICYLILISWYLLFDDCNLSQNICYLTLVTWWLLPVKCYQILIIWYLLPHSVYLKWAHKILNCHNPNATKTQLNLT